MNTSGLLDQLLKSGQSLLQKQQANGALGGLSDLLGKKTGQSPSNLGGLLSGAGGGALAAGALGLLLGNKKARKMGGKVAVYGGLAALGVVAYKAYSNWQAQQSNVPAGAIQTVDRLPAAQVEVHSQAILRALIAAAKADGHIDDRERSLIEGEFSKLGNDAALQQWLHTELNKPLDAAEVARGASSPEMAAEMYLASVLMVDDEHFMERAYLSELARQLKLDPQLVNELEAQVA